MFGSPISTIVNSTFTRVQLDEMITKRNKISKNQQLLANGDNIFRKGTLCNCIHSTANVITTTRRDVFEIKKKLSSRARTTTVPASKLRFPDRILEVCGLYFGNNNNEKTVHHRPRRILASSSSERR